MNINEVRSGHRYRTSLDQVVEVLKVNRKSKTALCRVISGFLEGRDRTAMAEDIIEEVTPESALASLIKRPAKKRARRKKS